MTSQERNRVAGRILIALAVLMALLPLAVSVAAAAPQLSVANAGQSARQDHSTPLVRTDSPREMLASFLRLRDALEIAIRAYDDGRTVARADRVKLLLDELRTLLDLSQVPAASRREVSGDTVAYLLNIFGRIDLPNPDSVPDLEAVEAEKLAYYVIPGTPFRIARIDAGSRTGEFLFSEGTVRSAPWFYTGIQDLPLRSSVAIGSWIDATRRLTGPMIPAWLVDAVPDSLMRPVLGTPVWKIVAVLALAAVAALFLFLVNGLLASGRPGGQRTRRWRRLLAPIVVIATTWALQNFVTNQVNIAGRFSRLADIMVTLVVFLSLAWAFWLAMIAVFESIIRRRDFPGENIDANMLRLIARILGIIGGIVFLGTGMQALGLPVTSVLAGLGIGGLAVALAIRPTLENLIGGFILYLNQPVRVGDFCGFGTQSGTIERIGVRSTQIRAIDRTLISIPNAQFADMQIINWAQCDEMLIQQVIGLRQETDSDQMRHVLAKIREMFHSHPRINSETVRVRFDGYGASSLDIAVRVYARTREWNDYFAIREDVLFRIKEIIAQSGTAVSVPTQTLYVSRDKGLDADRGEKARQEVARWRQLRRLPFPRFAPGTLEDLSGRLKYPPPGSPDYAAKEAIAEGEERLSADPAP